MPVVFGSTAIVGAIGFSIWLLFVGRARALDLRRHELMGLLDHYRQFEALSRGGGQRPAARARPQERRRRALARVEPIDLSRTTWPEFPPSTVVNAITFAARRGLHRYVDRHAGELRGELAERHGVEPEPASSSATASRSC